MEYDFRTYGDISVSYTNETAGGGERYGQDYLKFLPANIGKVNRVFEWCAGVGFIGFSLLANGLCNSLCLADVNEEAVDACRDTIQRNGLENRVDVYASDGLRDIPDSESWDLVVGNPPHSGTDEQLMWAPELIYMDADWKVHKDFYASVSRFLAPDANVIVMENKNVSSIDDFAPMIDVGNLRFLKTEDCPPHDHIYYVWSAPTKQ